MSNFVVSFKNNCINQLLSGGFKSKKMYHIYGMEGIGKSTFCLELAYLVAKEGYKTLYISSNNNFNIKRMEQIAGKSISDILGLIFVQKPKNFKNQDKIINKLENFLTKQFKLIIIDDIISLFQDKNAYDNKSLLKNRILSRELAILKSLSIDFDVITLITNLSSSQKDENNNNMPILKSVTTFYSDFDLEIRKTQYNSLSKRLLVKIKPKISSDMEYCEFNLSNQGIE
ncbi:MAG: ATP-binding protein [Candidatus Helarchaeota archaeon]